jgi:uncharacterized protein (DUF58 family)
MPTPGVDITLDELIGLRWPAQRLRMTAATAVASPRSGGHVSRWRGRGIDFDEVRAYQPGDDIRAMDWRVTARTGRAHTKLFHEERERPVLIAVDLGATMRFGTRVAFKSVTAARVAAFWAWIAARHGDRVGGVVFGEHGCIAHKPHAGPGGVLRLLHALVDGAPRQTPEAGDGLQQALLSLKWVSRPGSLIVLVSDFWSWDAAVEASLRQLQQHGEVIAVHVYDRFETEAPPPGVYDLSDGERTLTLDAADAAFRSGYQARFDAHARRLQTALRDLGAHYLRVATHDDVPLTLGRELRGVYLRPT